MTTFRYDQLRADDVTLTFISSSEPDTIGVEFAFDGNALFEMTMNESGATAILFDEIENAELPLTDLRGLLDRGEKELLSWHARLTRPGEMWAKD